MIIVRQWGGLGNQMFIDAFVQALIMNGETVKVDLSYYGYFPGRYELKNIFGIERDVATYQECRRYATYQLDLFHRGVRKFICPLTKKSTHVMVHGFDNQIYHPEYMTIKNCYIEGYFQTERYFNHIRNIICDNFQFPRVGRDNMSTVDEIKNSESVSLHIRRGDYLKQGSSFCICDMKYYENAIAYMTSIYSNFKFFVFSNDIQWCKDKFGLSDKFYYIDNNVGDKSYVDMQLMSMCKHNVIANSTFSWWGAWLNQSKEKIVCAPSAWFGPNFSGDIIPVTWKRISLR